jgi:hypothetical protein
VLVPIETDTAVLIPVTDSGVDELVVVPLPSWPLLLEPQHLTVPSESKAQLLLKAVTTEVAVLIPVTDTGVEELFLVPSPS